MTPRRWSRRASCLASCLALGASLTGCDGAGIGDGSSGAESTTPRSAPGELHLEASADLFADAAFDGHAEATAPGVVASIDVEAWGSATVEARVIASASSGDVTLGEAQSGATIAIEGGVAIDGRLVVDLPGIADYDGPIPGLDDHELLFQGVGSVDALSSTGRSARAVLPVGDRPAIALPGVDGSLFVAIGEDSYLETTLVAECANADEERVEVRGRLVTSGLLVLTASLEVDAAVLGAQSIALAEAEIAIEGESAVVMTAPVADLASEATAGQAQLPACR